MSKKIPLGLVLTVVFAAVALTVAITVSVCTQSYNKIIRDLPQRTERYYILSELDEIIGDRYYGDIEQNALLSDIAQGYINGLNDSRCFYIAEGDLASYKNCLSGKMPGCGLTVVYNSSENYLSVTETAHGSAAEEENIAVGSRIVTVGGVKVSADNASSLSAKLQEQTDKSIEIGILMSEEKAEEQTVETVMLRCGYDAVFCTYKAVSKVGYIHFSEFYEGTVKKFNEAVDALTASGVTSLIIDVRNNSSVNYDNVYSLIDRIVPLANEGTGAIATAENKSGESIKTVPSDAESFPLPISVLVNEQTSGAGELFAADLRDFGKAKLFGEKTAGNGKLSELIPLESGGALMLTTAVVYPYLSDTYDEVGIVPDQVIPSDRTLSIPPEKFEDDTQFNAAYMYLSK